MPRGVVKWFDTRKGFGFISGDGDTKDIFVHYTNIGGDGFRKLRDGEPVEYDLIDTDKGPQAANVKPIGEPEGESKTSTEGDTPTASDASDDSDDS